MTLDEAVAYVYDNFGRIEFGRHPRTKAMDIGVYVHSCSWKLATDERVVGDPSASLVNLVARIKRMAGD